MLSDVHANLPALEVVLEAVDAAGVDRIVHAGDVVGYNPFPNEVIRLLRRRDALSVRGNHDRAAVTGDTRWFNAHAAAAIAWTRNELTEASMAYLRSLRPREEMTVDGRTVLLVHGSPGDEDAYVFPHQATPTLLQEAGSDVLVMGHTHVPYVLPTPSGLVLNAGSVGQPRDGDPRAAWVLLDPAQPAAELRRVTYDVATVYKAVLERGLPQLLAERLLVGR